MGKHSDAEPLLVQALAIRRRNLGEESGEVALTLNNLASVYTAQARYAEAEPLLVKALDIWRLSLGEHHPSVSRILTNLAALHVATGREKQALLLMEKAEAINDQIVGQVFSIASESQRMAFLSVIQSSYFGLLSLVSQHLATSPEAARVAFDLVLRRKAIAAEALAAQRDAVMGGRYPSLKTQLQELTDLRMRIARITLAEPELAELPARRELLARWNAQRDVLETELVRQIPEMNLSRNLEADRHAIALALPEGAALIEFVRFDVFDFNAVLAKGESRWRPARYVAFVLSARAPNEVALIDLGQSEPIDQMIAGFRAWITGEGEDRGGRDLDALSATLANTAASNDGSVLRKAIFQPLLAAIRGTKRLLIAPDGDLTRMPFEVLPTDNRRLIDDYVISYLSVGRDVTRFGEGCTGQPAAALVVADPDFDLCGDSSSGELQVQVSVSDTLSPFPRSRLSPSLDLSRLHFERLPGTHIEGEQIAKMLGVEPWLEGMALEAHIKLYRSPYILHLATHGFFLEDQSRKGSGVVYASVHRPGPPLENPLLRSGLALAGANTWAIHGHPPLDAEDGLMTAEDVSGLDLFETQLVVLSACETGLGEIQTGEGVFGMRRAFVLAGAKTLVMSLWKVPDLQTQELMEKFYRRILQGQPRAEALRRAQLDIRAQYSHPGYWGAFICQGDFGPLPPTQDSALPS
jgi:CHAT domain-containing protein